MYTSGRLKSTVHHILSHYSHSRSRLALLPLLLFVSIFLGSGFYFQLTGTDYAFYQLPAPVAILPAIILALWLSKDSLNTAIEQFVAGVGHSNIITMCLIYLLAGAFSSVAKATGGVDAVVALGLSHISHQWLLPGLFLLSAFVATAMGTSMGTIAALAPIGLGIADSANIPLALMGGVLMSGAIFGDNLSIISDTTIAATRTQGCKMRDKFRENSRIAMPAALITLLSFFMLSPESSTLSSPDGNLWLALPYILILVLAIFGINVFVVLAMGIATSAVFGVWQSDYMWNQIGSDIYAGFSQMQEIFVLSMLIGGLSELMKLQGGLAYLVTHLSKLADTLSGNKRSSHSVLIAALAALTNLCVANNTVSILIVGDTAKSLAQQADISPKRSASILDIFACIVQGIIPYGAQALLLAASLNISPLALTPYSLYCWILAIIVISVLTYRLFFPSKVVMGQPNSAKD